MTNREEHKHQEKLLQARLQRAKGKEYRLLAHRSEYRPDDFRRRLIAVQARIKKLLTRRPT
ncbi:MAG: hypothetical protein ABFD89_12585 [Bryobacteraceae bacterium]